MKKIFTVLVLMFVASFAICAQLDPSKLLFGKTVEGKAKDDRTRTFVFSKDGKTMTLKQPDQHKHTFVKRIGNVIIYEGSFKGKLHFDGFKLIDENTVLVSAPGIAGEIQKTEQDYKSPE